MKTLLFTKGILSFAIIFVLGITTLVAQEKEDFKNHQKGYFSVGLNIETVLNSRYQKPSTSPNLDLGYHITDKWLIGVKLKMNQTANTFDLGGSFYSRYYIMDFGKRKRASWFAEGAVFYSKNFEREPIPVEESNIVVNWGTRLGTGVDVAITKSLMFTGQVFYERSKYDLTYSSSTRNNLGLSLGLKWVIGKKK